MDHDPTSGRAALRGPGRRQARVAAHLPAAVRDRILYAIVLRALRRLGIRPPGAGRRSRP
ncbi:MAG: hypothetical protein L6R48_03790 [Planctomycetes bacterium]|nr:hypothetical protein [Planctomycetota bacterium]